MASQPGAIPYEEKAMAESRWLVIGGQPQPAIRSNQNDNVCAFHVAIAFSVCCVLSALRASHAELARLGFSWRR